MAIAAEAVGSIVGPDPNSAGGAAPIERAQAESGRVVHPDSAPSGTEPKSGGAPDSAPSAEPTEQAQADDWKASLPPDVAKNVDRVITELRQKDTGRYTEMEQKVQRLQWADQLSSMVSSPDPSVRMQAANLLKGVLSTVESGIPPTAAAREAESPLNKIDWENAEAVTPGIKAAFTDLFQRYETLAQTVEATKNTAEGTAYQAAQVQFDREVGELEAWTKQRGLPFNKDILQKVVDTENQLKITDLRKAYYATMGDDLIAVGRKSAQDSLQSKKAASLPGGTVGAGAPSRPKFTSMHEAFEYAKQQAGITGPIEYKG